LSQIVWNLISNVEKYASSGEWLSVSVSQVDGSLRVRVCDRGEGIPRERRAKVFKPFERVSDSTKEGVSGTGLGLSISRELAESMGGSLSLLDDPEMTIFELIIPLKTT
jgi:signal transduction histidine kinase